MWYHYPGGYPCNINIVFKELLLFDKKLKLKYFSLLPFRQSGNYIMAYMPIVTIIDNTIPMESTTVVITVKYRYDSVSAVIL